MPPSTSYTQQWADQGTIDYCSLRSGLRLRYLKVGSGPPLLLMHTVRTQLDYFQRLVPLLARRYNVYAVDLPGMGWSDMRADGDYSEPAVRRDMAEFIRSLGLSDVTLAGDSMGATLALALAVHLGRTIRQVYAINPYDYPQGVERSNALASLAIKLMRVPVIGLAVAAMENALVLGAILRGGFFDPRKLPQPFVHELIRSGRRGGYPKVEVAYLRALGSYIAAREIYAQVAVPVTLVYGDHDWSTPAERDQVSRHMPAAALVRLTHTGHFASLEQPEEIARILCGE